MLCQPLGGSLGALQTRLDGICRPGEMFIENMALTPHTGEAHFNATRSSGKAEASWTLWSTTPVATRWQQTRPGWPCANAANSYCLSPLSSLGSGPHYPPQTRWGKPGLARAWQARLFKGPSLGSSGDGAYPRLVFPASAQCPSFPTSASMCYDSPVLTAGPQEAVE